MTDRPITAEPSKTHRQESTKTDWGRLVGRLASRQIGRLIDRLLKFSASTTFLILKMGNETAYEISLSWVFHARAHVRARTKKIRLVEGHR